MGNPYPPKKKVPTWEITAINKEFTIGFVSTGLNSRMTTQFLLISYSVREERCPIIACGRHILFFPPWAAAQLLSL